MPWYQVKALSQSFFFSNPDSKGTEGPTCSNCKRSSHAVDRCWAKGGGAEGKGPKMRPSKGNLKGKGKKAGSAKVAKDNQSPSPPPAVYITHAEALMSKDTSNPMETYFYLDSVASNHICHTQDYFSSYQKLESPRRIKTANGYSNAISIGDITVCTYLNGKSCVGIFKSVLHLPTAEQMLISVAQLSDSGIKLVHTSEYAIDLVNHHTEEMLSEVVTLGSPRYGQGPLGPADIRSATRLPSQPPGPPGVPLLIRG